MQLQCFLTLISITAVIALPSPDRNPVVSGQTISVASPSNNGLRNFAVGLPVVGGLILGGLKWFQHMDEKTATQKDLDDFRKMDEFSQKSACIHALLRRDLERSGEQQLDPEQIEEELQQFGSAGYLMFLSKNEGLMLEQNAVGSWKSRSRNPKFSEYVQVICTDANKREEHVMNHRKKLRAEARKLARGQNQQTAKGSSSKDSPNAFSLLDQARSSFLSHMKLTSPKGTLLRGARQSPRFIGH